jgi:3-hydroxymyristoyl/3-hydroxydecanoyl-(acyl carrier protein) dehydratase
MTTVEITASHPAFDGHFPGHPVLPGVVLLAEAMAVLQAATGVPAEGWTLDNAKFLSPVAPGTTLAVHHAVAPSGAVRFEIRAGERLVASGTLARIAA